MKECLNDHTKCDSLAPKGRKERCLWPLNHGDKTSFKKKNEIRGIPIILQHGIQAADLQIETRRQRIDMAAIDNDADKISDNKLLSLLEEIHTGLKSEVYDQESITVINATKHVLDLPALSIKLHQPDGGNIKVAATNFPLFIEAVKEAPIRSLQAVPVDHLKEEYAEFLKRLQTLTATYKLETLKTTDPKDLIKTFFNPEDRLFVGIEMIIEAIAVCCVKQSCESILESLVWFPYMKIIFIAANGPNLAHCNSVIEDAMNIYWQGKKSNSWHFYRTCLTDHLKDFDEGSKVLHRLFNERSKFQSME
jgi:hypothetical protein